MGKRTWTACAKGLAVCAGLSGLAGTVRLAAAAFIGPSITVNMAVDGGSIIPVAGGSEVLDPASPTAGAPGVSGGLFWPAPATTLGKITLYGNKKDNWRLSVDPLNNATLSFTDLNNVKHMLGYRLVGFNPPAQSGAVTGTFSKDAVPFSGPIYIGLTVDFGSIASNPEGTYKGAVTLKLVDTSAKTHPSVSQVVPITLKLVTPIGLTPGTGLDFGSVVPGSSPGTVVMPATGQPRICPGGIVSALASSPGSAATFTVTGSKGCSYSVTLPASATLSDNAGHTVTVDTFTRSPSGSGALGPQGSQALAVGATLKVGAGQPPGSYTGFFTVVVAY